MEKEKKRCTAIVLAAGRGSRMGSKVHKQYLDLLGKPVIYYSLHTFQESGIIDDIILVAGKGQTEYVRKEIVERYGFTKVSHITEGGKERYESVWEGLKVIRDRKDSDIAGYVFIHDSARPFVDENILKRGFAGVKEHHACVIAMPSKDTVKLADEKDFAASTPDRNKVWIVQTPQIFEISLIIEAYSKLMGEQCIQVTDDAMVVEQEMNLPVKLIEGTYENIKITTPEDLDLAEVFVKRVFGKMFPKS